MLAFLSGLAPFWLVVLLCPLMMIFMMRGMHGGHGEHDDHAAQGGTPRPDDEPTAARLHAMEEEITGLRREVAAAKREDRANIPRDVGHA